MDDFVRPSHAVEQGHMQPLFEHGVTLGGYSTRVLELEGEGPPLVFLHGFSDSADTWRATLAKLGRLDRRAVALDMPGFGKAAALKPGKVLPQLDRFGEAAVRYAAPDGGAIVVGNSLGGCVALRLAERDSLGLEGIVPVAPAGLDMARWLALIERDPIVRTLLSSPLPLPEWALRRAVAEAYRRIAFHRPRAVDAKAIDAFTSHFREQRTVARYLQTGRALLPELKKPFRLERIACPVLVVWGEHDRMVFSKGAERVLDAVPGARLELVEDCGHCPQVECPDRFTELLLDFPPAALAEAA
jgi:pimeloyl-ACP methyl ester carboxylesterase